MLRIARSKPASCRHWQLPDISGHAHWSCVQRRVLHATGQTVAGRSTASHCLNLFLKDARTGGSRRTDRTQTSFCPFSRSRFKPGCVRHQPNLPRSAENRPVRRIPGRSPHRKDDPLKDRQQILDRVGVIQCNIEHDQPPCLVTGRRPVQPMPFRVPGDKRHA